MRKFFEREWHNIRFAEHLKVSSTRFPGLNFYDDFYMKFFEKYKDINELDPAWISLKKEVARFIIGMFPDIPKYGVLSIGCGIGIIENILLSEGCCGLEVTEVSNVPLSWVKDKFAPGSIHTGLFPDCIPVNKKYDLIMLIDIEACFDQPQFMKLLIDVKAYLNFGGKCLLVSSAIEPKNIWRRALLSAKDLLMLFLEKLSIVHRGQLWGYKRSRSEFYQAMRSAGFGEIVDSEPKMIGRFDTYWIKAVNVLKEKK